MAASQSLRFSSTDPQPGADRRAASSDGVDQVGVECEQVIGGDWPGLQPGMGEYRFNQHGGSGDEGGVEIYFGAHAPGMIIGPGQARRLRPEEATRPAAEQARIQSAGEPQVSTTGQFQGGPVDNRRRERKRRSRRVIDLSII